MPWWTTELRLQASLSDMEACANAVGHTVEALELLSTIAQPTVPPGCGAAVAEIEALFRMQLRAALQASEKWEEVLSELYGADSTARQPIIRVFWTTWFKADSHLPESERARSMTGLKTLAALFDSSGARDARLPQGKQGLISRVRSTLLQQVSDNISRAAQPEIAQLRRQAFTADLVRAGDTFGELADALEI